MKWLFWRRQHRNGNGDAAARAEQEHRLRAAERATPQIERAARQLQDLPADELLRRINRAFGAGQ